MRRTHLEVSKDFQYAIDLGMSALYWYLSLILMTLFMRAFGVNVICLYATVGIAAAYFWYALSFTWSWLDLKDYNGSPYWISNIFMCYFKGTWIGRKHDKIYGN